MSRCGSKEAFTNFIRSALRGDPTVETWRSIHVCHDRDRPAQVDPHSCRGRPRRTTNSRGLTLPADRHQTDRLLAWAEPLDADRVWAIESAAGLGRLLAQQLIAAGEHVVDVPPTLAARVRLLGSSKASKNDPNDAFATAIAGLRHCGLRTVRS